MKLAFSRYILEKHVNIKFHENSSSGSRCFMLKDGHIETNKLGVASGNFVKPITSCSNFLKKN